MYWLISGCCDRFPRVFALESAKEVLVVDKMGAPSFSTSFRRQIRDGAKKQQWTDLLSTLDPIRLPPSSDRWVCDLNGEGMFRVKDIQLVLNDMYLPATSDATRWVKCVPIKVNVFTWLSSTLKSLLEGVFITAWWLIWSFRNRLLFDDSPPRQSWIFYDVVSFSYNWCANR
nr:RNA-directed DNA polymerase, eukaryota [Tanacetum cinerariifolium]